MKAATMISKLEAAFPKLDLRTTTEFYGAAHEIEGVWLRGSYNYDLSELDVMNPDESENPLFRFIDAAGWYVSPYDSETFMAYEI